MVQLMREGCSYTYPPLSIARYSFIQISELEQRRVKQFAQDFVTAAQDSNQGSRSRESEALPLIHCSKRGLLTGVVISNQPQQPLAREFDQVGLFVLSKQ